MWHESFYDNVVPQQGFINGNLTDRVLMFGGSRYNGSTWVVNDAVWQFEPAASDPVKNGQWREKTQDTAFQRLFSNAVALPTGEIFVVGGSSTDDGAGHKIATTVPVHVPIIYDPDLDSGSLSPGVVHPQPENEEVLPPVGGVADHTARIYHSVAALMPDGSVLVAGGRRQTEVTVDPVTMETSVAPRLDKPDARYTGEVFYPPYLDPGTGLSRPLVSLTGSAAINFEATFTLEATRDNDCHVDRIVLLRPAAITHHFDNDQRYVELFHLVSSSEVGSEQTVDTVQVAAPTGKQVPPGLYMLFVVTAENSGCTETGHRVPSVAEWIRLK